MRFAIYKVATGEITKFCANGNTVAMQCAEDEAWIDRQDNIGDDESHYVVNGALVAKPVRPSPHHSFNYSTKKWLANVDRAWRSVRSQRDKLLASTDWLVTKAIETNVPMSNGWATYRQALRDITNQADPLVVEWPTPPNGSID